MNRTQQKEVTLEAHPKNSAARAIVALLLATMPCLSACTSDVAGGLVIVQNQTPTSSDKGCLIPSKASMERQISGVYDVDLDRPYPFWFYPLVVNNLPATAKEGTVELNRVEYTGVEVKIVPPAGVAMPSTATCPTEFSFPDRASMLPDGELGSAVQIFLPCHSAALLAMFKSGALPGDLNAEIRFKAVVRATGKHGASIIKSDPFEYPVRVCKGCLQVGYADDFTLFSYPAVPACTGIKTNPYRGNSCNPAQDAPILCCDRGNKQLVCPAEAVDPATK
jgi:hypothetical protein